MTPEDRNILESLRGTDGLTTKMVAEAIGMGPEQTVKKLKSLERYGFVQGRPFKGRKGGLTYLWRLTE